MRKQRTRAQRKTGQQATRRRSAGGKKKKTARIRFRGAGGTERDKDKPQEKKDKAFFVSTVKDGKYLEFTYHFDRPATAPTLPKEGGETKCDFYEYTNDHLSTSWRRAGGGVPAEEVMVKAVDLLSGKEPRSRTLGMKVEYTPAARASPRRGSIDQTRIKLVRLALAAQNHD